MKRGQTGVKKDKCMLMRCEKIPPKGGCENSCAKTLYEFLASGWDVARVEGSQGSAVRRASSLEAARRRGGVEGVKVARRGDEVYLTRAGGEDKP